jgi:ABC-type uncharacterized transport system substrate-binding protein
MRRRDFITLLGGGAAAWPLAARAQQKAMSVIGFLHPSSAEAYVSLMPAFRNGLGEAGYVEGQNFMIEYLWAEDQYDRLPALAAELVSQRVNVIATANATAAALAAKGATSTIPIVFTIGADPVQFGPVASLNRPGGNVTGVSFLSNVLVAKQLELLREFLPAASELGLLVNPRNPNGEFDTKQAKAAADSVGRKIHVVYDGTWQRINEKWHANEAVRHLNLTLRTSRAHPHIGKGPRGSRGDYHGENAYCGQPLLSDQPIWARTVPYRRCRHWHGGQPTHLRLPRQPGW